MSKTSGIPIRSVLCAAGFLCFGLAPAVSPARAETVINVNTFDDVVDAGDGRTSLREAINAANGGADDYRIYLTVGGQMWPYNLTGNGDNANATGDLDINTPGRTVTITVTVVGSQYAWIASAYADRLLHVHAGNVVVDHVKFSHGQANDDGSGGADGCGGAILLESGASLTLNSVDIDGCAARGSSAWGGAIHMKDASSLTIEGGVMTGNSAWGADGADGDLPAEAGGNGGSGAGGVLCIFGAGTATVNRCIISGNGVCGGNGGDGHQGGGGLGATPGGAGGDGGSSGGSFAAVVGGRLQGDCVVLGANWCAGGNGGNGGAGALDVFFNPTDGGDGGAGGSALDSERSIYVWTTGSVQLGGYGDRLYGVGTGGTGGSTTNPASPGSDGASGIYYDSAVLKCLNIRSYRSENDAGSFAEFLGGLTFTLHDTNGVSLCYDISRPASETSHNAGLCFTYPAAAVVLSSLPSGYRRGAKPPSAFDRYSGLSEALINSSVLQYPLYNGPLYVSPSGSDHYPFCSWSGASRTITNALAAAPEGSLVLLDTATHTQSCMVVVTNRLTLRGDTNHPETVIVRQAAPDVPCFRLTHSNALLEGMTIRGVRSIENGGGVYFAGGGMVNRCIITDNQAANGAGVDLEAEGGGLVTHTIIRGNTALGAGGGAVCC